MTEIKSTIFPDAEAWLTENMLYFEVDSIAAVYPVTTFNPDGLTRYCDAEEGTTKERSMEDHVLALRKLCELVDGKKLFVGGVRGSMELTDGLNWDIEVVDAYFQLVYYGEVIYG